MTGLGNGLITYRTKGRTHDSAEFVDKIFTLHFDFGPRLFQRASTFDATEVSW
jgi:hypothetical protein